MTLFEDSALKNIKLKKHIANILPCIYMGIICGAVTGGIIFGFKLIAKHLEELSRNIYSVSKSSPIYIVLCFAVLLLFAVGMTFLHKKVPEAKGGGIPRSEGILRGLLPYKHINTFIGTFIGSSISFLAGLPLGSEGPAVLIGTSLGGMLGRLSPNPTAWNRYIMTGGAGAGFAVATGAPLSGILFALEEIHKRFTPMLVLTVSMSVVSATYVNHVLCSVFEINPSLFHIEAFGGLELAHVGYLIILAVFIAAAVWVFDGSIAFFGRINSEKMQKVPQIFKMMPVFIFTGIMGFTLIDGIYSGHHMIDELLMHDKSLLMLALLFCVRLFMMLLVTDSGVTGGIFIPTLAIGVLAASIAAKLLAIIGMPAELYTIMLMLGMCSFIGGTLRAPLTAAVLFVELTGQFTNLFYVALVIFIVTAITELLNQKPFYDISLERLVHAYRHGKKPTIAHFEMKISENAFAVDKAIRDIMWPCSSVVIGIKRANSDRVDMDNDGEKKLYSGDTIVLRSRFMDEEELRRQLVGIVGSQYEINAFDV